MGLIRVAAALLESLGVQPVIPDEGGEITLPSSFPPDWHERAQKASGERSKGHD